MSSGDLITRSGFRPFIKERLDKLEAALKGKPQTLSQVLEAANAGALENADWVIGPEPFFYTVRGRLDALTKSIEGFNGFLAHFQKEGQLRDVEPLTLGRAQDFARPDGILQGIEKANVEAEAGDRLAAARIALEGMSEALQNPTAENKDLFWLHQLNAASALAPLRLNRDDLSPGNRDMLEEALGWLEQLENVSSRFPTEVERHSRPVVGGGTVPFPS